MNSDDQHPPAAPAETPLAPTELIRQMLANAGIEYDYDDESDTVRFGSLTEHAEVTVLARGQAGNSAAFGVRLPIRIPKRARPAAGELLHRINYATYRKFWEIDYDDGEVRLTAVTDLFYCDLREELAGAIMRRLVEAAETVIPYLNAVTCGSMKPDFAADQALTALANRGGEPGEP
jgi:hypothetical protein